MWQMGKKKYKMTRWFKKNKIMVLTDSFVRLVWIWVADHAEAARLAVFLFDLGVFDATRLTEFLFQATFVPWKWKLNLNTVGLELLEIEIYLDWWIVTFFMNIFVIRVFCSCIFCPPPPLLMLLLLLPFMTEFRALTASIKLFNIPWFKF